MDNNKETILESCLLLNEKEGFGVKVAKKAVSANIKRAQTNALSQKLNISAVIRVLRQKLKKAQTVREVQAVRELAQKNITGFKKYWKRNTASKVKTMTNVKEETFRKAIADMEKIIRDCEVKKKKLMRNK
jgi:hypothetical protein